MILSISKTRTITPKSFGNDKETVPSTITYRVPTAEEIEKHLAEKTSNAKMFVLYTESSTFTDDKGNEIKPADIPKMSGTYALVNEVATAIVKSGMLGTDVKNG